jgi:hypothetical protein
METLLPKTNETLKSQKESNTKYKTIQKWAVENNGNLLAINVIPELIKHPEEMTDVVNTQSNMWEISKTFRTLEPREQMLLVVYIMGLEFNPSVETNYHYDDPATLSKITQEIAKSRQANCGDNYANILIYDEDGELKDIHWEVVPDQMTKQYAVLKKIEFNKE